MATSNDTGDIQDATPTAGFVKLSLTSQKPANSVDARFAQYELQEPESALRTKTNVTAYRAFNEERFCDMTIKTRDGTIPVHKAVICLQSPVIAKAMDGQFLVCIILGSRCALADTISRRHNRIALIYLMRVLRVYLDLCNTAICRAMTHWRGPATAGPHWRSPRTKTESFDTLAILRFNVRIL